MKKGVLLIGVLLFFFNASLFSQDKLVFNDQKIVECKVIEITPDLIKYTKFSMPDGPLYSVYKREVNSIVFENGEIELIRTASSVPGLKPQRNMSRDEHPDYRGTFGVDPIALAFREFRIWFETRNAKDRIGHTFTMTGYWDAYGDYYYDDFIGDYYSYPYGGGLAFGYMPKIYFIQHKIARPYFAPETSLGFHISDFSGGYFRSMFRFGVALNPTPRFNIDLDIGGGGYVVFDGFSNYGTGLLTFGLSFGMNYGSGERRGKHETVSPTLN